MTVDDGVRPVAGKRARHGLDLRGRRDIGVSLIYATLRLRLYEVDRLELVGAMLDLIRQSQLGAVQLDTYMRYDALIGPPVVEFEKLFGLMPADSLEYRPRPEQSSEQPAA